MENTFELAKQLQAGYTVTLATEEGEFNGIFKRNQDGPDDNEIQLVKCVHMGKELPGVQSFSLLDIETLVSPDIITPIKVNHNSVERHQNDLDNEISKVPVGSNVQKPKSKPKIKDRPVICKVRKKNIADISHLNNLHLLRMPELMEQIQIEDPSSLQPYKDMPHAFCIPKPEQDSEHMEGDKYKGRHSLEYTAARNQTWKDVNIPPECHFPEQLFVINDSQDSRFAEALEQLNKTRTIGVSLEGQFLGRHGKLSVISFSTQNIVYMFDVVSIGDCCFDLGLRKILEDVDIQKGILKIT